MFGLSERAWRIGIHVPVGILNVQLGLNYFWLGSLFGAGFIVYQLMEFVQLRNRGWIDVHGWLAGLAIGAFIPYNAIEAMRALVM